MIVRGLGLAAAIILMLQTSANTVGAAPADHSTLDGHLVVGFQGWFMCPGDGRPNGGWWHWFAGGKADAAHLRIDLLPDVGELDPDEICPTDLVTADGKPIGLFSDQNPKTVARQFRWMRDAGIDTAAIQRFLVDLDPVHPVAGPAAVDRVLRNALAGAESADRGVMVMYDIVGADPERWADILATDWAALLARGITGSPAYQRHRGHPVLAIAGVGSNDRPGTAAEMLALLAKLRAESAPYGGVTLMGSVATGWRTLDHDAKTDPLWKSVFASFDILSPWTVGRYKDAASFDRFVSTTMRPDIAAAQQLGIDYMPVIFPGFSWHHIYAVRGDPGQRLNAIPRDGGQFYWMQAVRGRREGARMLYAAMFDEVDEGTALFKLTTTQSATPRDSPMVTLDQDGTSLPNDWYLSLSGKISKLLKKPSDMTDHAMPQP